MQERYSRQVRFSPIGEEGQARLSKTRVLLVGCGALGTHLAETLVRAGVGALDIVDRDVVEASNLQRQLVFNEAHAKEGVPKAMAAQAWLQSVNSTVDVTGHAVDFSHLNALELAGDVDVIVDATDNFETRFLLNDVAVKLSKPWVYAACIGSTSLAMPIIPGETACLACLLEELPSAGQETCETAGIIMPSVMIAASFAATEVLKLATGNHAALRKVLHVYDAWSGSHQSINAAEPREGCAVCGAHEYASLSGRRGQQAVSLCGRNTVQVSPSSGLAGSLADVAQRVVGIAKVVDSKDFLLRLEVSGKKISLFPDGRALISGTDDVSEARSLYAKVIGA